MKRSFRLTPLAARDIDEILSYILERSGPARALHVHKRLYDGLSKIARNPGLGHLCKDVWSEGLRIRVVFSYLIIYRPETMPVQILRVIHGARDLRQALEEDSD